MAKRNDPASQVVEFFETASVETAQTVLAICKGVVQRRMPGATRKPRASRTQQATTAAAPSQEK